MGEKIEKNIKNYKEKLSDLMDILNNEKIYCYSQYRSREHAMDVLEDMINWASEQEEKIDEILNIVLEYPEKSAPVYVLGELSPTLNQHQLGIVIEKLLHIIVSRDKRTRDSSARALGKVSNNFDRFDANTSTKFKKHLVENLVNILLENRKSDKSILNNLLKPLSERKNPDIRASIYFAIGKIGHTVNQEEAEYLCPILMEDVKKEKETSASYALISVSSKLSKNTANLIFDDLMKLVEDIETDITVKSYSILTLGTIFNKLDERKKAVAFDLLLKSTSRENNRKIRTFACRALGKAYSTGDKERGEIIINRLENILKNGKGGKSIINFTFASIVEISTKQGHIGLLNRIMDIMDQRRQQIIQHHHNPLRKVVITSFDKLNYEERETLIRMLIAKYNKFSTEQSENLRESPNMLYEVTGKFNKEEADNFLDEILESFRNRVNYFAKIKHPTRELSYMSTTIAKLHAKLSPSQRLILINKLLNLIEDENYKEHLYLFSWDDVPGKDNKRLVELLERGVMNWGGMGWVKNAEIKKSDDNKGIIITGGNNLLLLKLEKEKGKVILEFRNIQIYECLLKEDDNKLDVYLDLTQILKGVIRSWLLDDWSIQRLFEFIKSDNKYLRLATIDVINEINKSIDKRWDIIEAKSIKPTIEKLVEISKNY